MDLNIKVSEKNTGKSKPLNREHNKSINNSNSLPQVSVLNLNTISTRTISVKTVYDDSKKQAGKDAPEEA